MRKKLTQEEKKEFVINDMSFGRSDALESIPRNVLQNNPQLNAIINLLINYDNFGDGDEVESILWTKIIERLGLEDAYNKYWN